MLSTQEKSFRSPNLTHMFHKEISGINTKVRNKVSGLPALLGDPLLHPPVSAWEDALQVEIGFGARVVIKIINIKEIINMAHSSFFYLSLSLFSLFFPFKVSQFPSFHPPKQYLHTGHLVTATHNPI